MASSHTDPDLNPRLSIHANRHCPKCQGATAKDWLAARQALDIATWFCDAYASWQKGAVENINGRLRRDLPKKIDIDRLSDHDLQDILLMHNLTPRKCLRFKTPAQALLQQLGLDIKISFHRGRCTSFLNPHPS